MSTEQPVRVGVIGCGLIAQVMHLHYLRELGDRFVIAALCDLSPGTLARVGDYYGVQRRFTDWRDMLKEDLDVVLILTSSSHAPAAIAAAKRGIHVFVEKPMCFTLREADEMIAACRDNRVTLSVGYMKRHDPAYRLARERLPDLSGLRYVQVTTLEAPLEPYVAHYPIQRAADIPAAVLERSRAERDVLLDEALEGAMQPDVRAAYRDLLLDSAVHELNLLRGFLGEPLAVQSAEFWDKGRSLHTLLLYPGDLRVGVSAVWLPVLKHYSQEFAFYAPDRRLILRFPSPFLRSEPTSVVLEDDAGGAHWEHRALASHDEAFKLELVHLYECVRQGKAPMSSGEDGRRDIQVALAILRSYVDRSQVEIDPAR
jgi:predicted dehydrogenase